jgi:hypothetical protein
LSKALSHSGGTTIANRHSPVPDSGGCTTPNSLNFRSNFAIATPPARLYAQQIVSHGISVKTQDSLYFFVEYVSNLCAGKGATPGIRPVVKTAVRLGNSPRHSLSNREPERPSVRPSLHNPAVPAVRVRSFPRRSLELCFEVLSQAAKGLLRLFHPPLTANR